MQPIQVVDQVRRAFENRDADRLAELLDPDVELRLVSASEPIIGRPAASDWYREAFESRLRFSSTAAVEDANKGSVLMRGRLSWFGPGGGSDREGAWVITFRDGLIASITAVEPSSS